MKRATALVGLFMFIAASAVAKSTAEAFGTLPTIHDAAISPDAAQLAVIVNFEGSYGVRVISLNETDEKRRTVMLGERAKPMWVRWANDHRVLLAVWQSELVRGVPITSSYIYTLDARTMKGRFLVRPKGMLRQDNSRVIDFLDSDPDHILMAFSDENQFYSDIQKVNVVTGRYKRVMRGQSSIQTWITDSNGEPRVGQGLRDRSSTKETWVLRIRDADGDEWRTSGDYPGLRPDSKIFGFTGDPDELVIGDYAGKDTLGIYVYDLSEKRVSRKLFHHDDYDASGLIVNSETHDVVGARFVADSPEVELFDEYDSLMSRMRSQFTEYTVRFIDQSDDGRVLVFKVSNAWEPGALMVVDAGDGEARGLAYYRPELPTEEMGFVTTVKYRARDGTLIPAYVTLPPSITDTTAIRHLPFIVLPHGGPYARKAGGFDYFAQFFATRGFGVLQMNFRGSSGYGSTYEDTGRENWVVMQADVTDGARWLLEKDYADPERLCIGGSSYGGYAALMGAIKHPDLYACAIAMAGVTDLLDLIKDMKKYRFGALSARKFVQEGFEDRAAMKDNSSVRRADELRVPLFLAHGTRDERVHFDQFKRMKSAQRKSPAEVTFLEFEDEDHFLSTQANRQAFFVRLDEFLETTIGTSEFAQ